MLALHHRAHIQKIALAVCVAIVSTLPTAAIAYSQSSYYSQGGYYSQGYYQASYASYSQLITDVPFSTGDGGYTPGGYTYYGGGGGGGIIIDGSTVNGAAGAGSPNNGGKGYGGGGGGANYNGYPGGSGAAGVVYVEWDVVYATCDVAFDDNPIEYGASTTLAWSSNAAETVYIANIGYVDESGAITISPLSTTNYQCVADGPGGSDGAHDAVLTVNEPPAPSCSIDISPSSINEGASSTITWESTLADDFYIENIGYVNATGTTTVSPSVTTSYAGEVTGVGGTESCTGDDTLTVYGSCTLDGVTLEHGESATFYSSLTATAGTVCADVDIVRTCTDGELSESDSYQYASCSCAVLYSCSDQTIMYTDAACATSEVTTCESPLFCSAGAATCQSPVPEFVEFDGGSGHLQARPQVVREGLTSTIYWNVSNVESCTVTGSNDDSWTGLTSGDSGVETDAIEERTSYTLSCEPYEGGSFTDETVYVNLVPTFRER